MVFLEYLVPSSEHFCFFVECSTIPTCYYFTLHAHAQRVYGKSSWLIVVCYICTLNFTFQFSDTSILSFLHPSIQCVTCHMF